MRFGGIQARGSEEQVATDGGNMSSGGVGKSYAEKSAGARTKSSFDERPVGLKITWEVGPSVGEAKDINSIRLESVKVCLQFGVGKVVGIVEGNPEVMRRRRIHTIKRGVEWKKRVSRGPEREDFRARIGWPMFQCGV